MFICVTLVLLALLCPATSHARDSDWLNFVFQPITPQVRISPPYKYGYGAQSVYGQQTNRYGSHRNTIQTPFGDLYSDRSSSSGISVRVTKSGKIKVKRARSFRRW